MCPNLFLCRCIGRKNSSTNPTLFVSVEQDALSFEDEDDIFWVGAIHDSCRLCAKELIGFVDFLKHVLKDPSSNGLSYVNHYIHIMSLMVIIRTLPSGFLSGWYFCASLK